MRTLLISAAAVLFLAINCQASCKTSDVLMFIRPGAAWTMLNDDAATLVWLSTQTIPTTQEIQAGFADCPNQVNLGQRNDAVGELLSDPSGNAKVLRAVFLVALDEINLLRERDVDRATDVAASISLADLKTRWAARSTLSDRTAQQFKTAVQNKVGSGAAD